MVARGDLGIELPIEEVPIVQKRILALAGALARPSITATQMLDSMVASSRPTRAEVADVANAILDGTDAVMLSQETAVGAYPVGAVEMMAKIAERVEASSRALRALERARACAATRATRPTRSRTRSAAPRASSSLAALVVPDALRPLRAARLRPPAAVPIYALSPGRETVRRCGLMWGVRAASMRRFEVTEELIADAARRVRRARLGQARRPRRHHRRAARAAARARRA